MKEKKRRRMEGEGGREGKGEEEGTHSLPRGGNCAPPSLPPSVALSVSRDSAPHPLPVPLRPAPSTLSLWSLRSSPFLTATDDQEVMLAPVLLVSRESRDGGRMKRRGCQRDCPRGRVELSPVQKGVQRKEQNREGEGEEGGENGVLTHENEYAASVSLGQEGPLMHFFAAFGRVPTGSE